MGTTRPIRAEFEVLCGLWSYGPLFANQIWRRWWPERTERWVYQRLKRMSQAGWLCRYKLVLDEGGSQQRFYGLSEAGFEIARGRRARRGLGIRRDARWRESMIDDGGGQLPRELHVNGWVLALEAQTGELITLWRGPVEGQVDPPQRRTREGWVAVRPADVVLGTSHRLTGYQSDALEMVRPAATVDLRLPDGGRVELMVEYERGEDPYETEERLRRYDLFVSGWAHMLRRYRPPARAPIVVFVCVDEAVQATALEIADRALTTQVSKAGTPRQEWPFPGRQSILFARERDIHERSLQSLAVPVLPSSALGAQPGERGTIGSVRQLELIDARLIEAAQSADQAPTDEPRSPREAQ
jgi:hypothetical protein